MQALANHGTDPAFKQAAENALKQNPALGGIKIVIEDYLDEAQSKQATASQSEVSSPDASATGSITSDPVVLLVGGDNNMYAVLRIVLYDVPHKLVWAKNASEVVELIHKEPPAIILGESVSSNADGFNLIQIAKTHTETLDTPVVLLNPESNLDSIFAAYSAINRKTNGGESVDDIAAANPGE